MQSTLVKYYTVKEANPDSLSTIHSTKRVRISLSHCVHHMITSTWGYLDTLHTWLEPALLGLQVGFKNLEGSIGVSSK